MLHVPSAPFSQCHTLAAVGDVAPGEGQARHRVGRGWEAAQGTPCQLCQGADLPGGDLVQV